jgi:tight adherence protein C
MLTFIAIVGLGLLAVAVTLLTRALVASSRRSIGTLENISAYGFSSRGSWARQQRSARAKSAREAIDQFAAKLGDVIAPRFRVLSERSTRERLVRAGMYATSAKKFVGYQILVVFAGAFVWVWLAGVSRIGTGMLVLGVLGIALLGWVMPFTYIDSRARSRRDSVERTLPDLIDLLVVTLEAGLSLPQSLRLASSRIQGPLAQELRLTMQEQSMGLTLVEALTNLQSRVDTPAVRLLTRSIAQGETLGVPTAQLMRNLAEEMRKRRRSYAEERAQKAPVKMLFPLVFLIYPAVFIVLVVPALLNAGEIF